MSLLTSAGAGHLSRLLPMVAAAHDEAGAASSDSRRRQSLEPVLRGTPLGAVWLIGPKIAPIGYVATGFYWSLAAAGSVAQIDEIWLRPEARGQGTGSRAVDELVIELQKRGAVAIQALIPLNAPRYGVFLARRGFFQQGGGQLASRRL